MSGPAVIRYLLANAAPVTAQVPATRIVSGLLPMKTALPAISVTQISGVERLPVDMPASGRFRTDRVQVTVLAKTYPSAKTILELARAACANVAGTVNGVAVDSILPDGVGPDFQDADAEICEQSRDFLVRWR